MACRKISSLLLLLLASSFALADIRIGVIASSTGPTAVVGIHRKIRWRCCRPRLVARKSNIFVLDDASDPTNAVTNVKKLISENKVDALIGPTTTPAALAMLDFVAESRVPLVTTVGSSAIILPLGRQASLGIQDDAERRPDRRRVDRAHDRDRGPRQSALSASTIPTVRTGSRCSAPMAEKAGLKMLASERFNRTDQSVTGQALKVMTSKPDAVLIAATGGPAVLPQITLQEKGYKGRIYQTHGVATNDFIRIGGKAVEGTLMAGGPMLVAADPGRQQPDQGGGPGLRQGLRRQVRRRHDVHLRRQYLRCRPAPAEGHPGWR